MNKYNKKPLQEHFADLKTEIVGAIDALGSSVGEIGTKLTLAEKILLLEEALLLLKEQEPKSTASAKASVRSTVSGDTDKSSIAKTDANAGLTGLAAVEARYEQLYGGKKK